MEVRGQPRAYISDAITKEDAERLSFTIGDCKGQAAAEALAILVALRAWLPLWGTTRTAVRVRSDSSAALGALGKLGSTAPHINLVAREVALDVALSRYGVDVWQHVRAEHNTEADMLSRWSSPDETKKDLPPRLAGTERTQVEQRGRDWWTTTSEYWEQRVGIKRGTGTKDDARATG